jgi:dienelactone hydrolase
MASDRGVCPSTVLVSAAGITLIAVLLLSAPSSFGQASDVRYRMFRPNAPGPHPAVVFVSGCDGFAPSRAPTSYERRAEHFRAQGYIVVFADYLGRRGLKSCAGSITHKDAAQDLVTAAAWLGSQAGVDRARITAIGWSYGGRAVLDALREHTQGQLAFSRAVAYYPDCRGLEPWKTTLPVLMLLAGDDNMTPAILCQEVVKRMAAPTAVKIVVYAGAQHAFDVSELPANMRLGFGTIGYHAEAAAAARDEVQRFLRSAR